MKLLSITKMDNIFTKSQNSKTSEPHKFMLEMNLKQPGFIYSACGPFTKSKERIKKFKETGDINYIL